MRFILLILATLAAMASGAAAQERGACGAGGRCAVAEGYYLAAPPPDWDGRTALPLVVYFHSWGHSPASVFRNKPMLRALHERGALVVAPFAEIGFWRQIGEGRAEHGRDEAAYVRRVLADVKRRWPIDETRMMASGFSRGASLVWNLACYEAGLFTAYAPIAGGFWASTPQDCPSGPVNLRHIHGAADRIVAYDAVGVYNSRPIPEGLALLRRVNGCAEGAGTMREAGRLRCERWSGCAGEAALEVCLHGAGHWFPAHWVAESFDWMAALGGGEAGAAR